ncbi:hypothetical protein K2Z84_03075 [Candidatus Binatia bacterium]|nr:hypothetical protein [Candidatus Binatia bacterium]
MRGFGDDVERRLRAVARAEGVSLNEAVLRLLRKGAGLQSSEAGNVIGDALDHLAGTWTDVDLREFDEAVRVTERIDDDLWRTSAPARSPRRR